jgi:capsular exopolysaccharide synthesis family protein
MAEMDRREADLEVRVGSASKGLERIPPRSIEEARLRRAVVVAEGLYNVLQQRLATARLAEVSSVPDIRILDRAMPPRSPVRNRGPRMVLMAFAGSLGLAIAGAILLDLVDPRVRFPSQVVNRLGLSVLGTIPRANGSDFQGTIEAFRAIRLNLVHAHGARGPLLLTVTSPSSAEGKSFVAANLALAFAQAGHRTLLIDGDNRRGGLHRLFDLKRKPGIMDVLKGRIDREGAVQQTAFDRLSFIGCGIRTQDGPELLDSPVMAELLGVFRSCYGVILIDSPPLGGGVDAFALATLTGNMVIVLRTGVSKQELAEVKLDIISGLPVRILGAVLNDVSAGSGSGRRRSYYSYHLPGYEAEDEEELLSERRPERRLLKSTERG